MRLLYIDIDSCRPDHLGCYGYHRATSPNIDRVASRGVRFSNCYATDVPCLPSRTALFSGRHGYHTGVVNHGGVRSQPFNEGPGRGFQDSLNLEGWLAALAGCGLHRVMVSSFAQRHSAHWFTAMVSELYNCGRRGMETAEEPVSMATDWIGRRGGDDNWFMHLNVWDPHTPYRTPEAFGNPFAGDPAPAWYTEEVRAHHWSMAGPHSPQEVLDYFERPDWMSEEVPARQPTQITSLDDARRMFDGYDCGVRYADEQIGRVLDALESRGVLDETAIIISADHGENLGELWVYGDHQTADAMTCRVPMIVSWPGVTDGQAGREDTSFVHPIDVAATSIALLGGEVPGLFDGVSFDARLRAGESADIRDWLVTSQLAWTAQRGVYFRRGEDVHLMLRTWHDSWRDYPDRMLFNLTADPHETRDLAVEEPGVVAHALGLLDEWTERMERSASVWARGQGDPLATVLGEGGPLHAAKGDLAERYLARLRETGRAEAADRLASKHARSLAMR